ncbi:hypothetical protein MC7420_2518 [Coleofasciculus chthonoplastes PCC 7420]|uniref:Uncharacterized protein n=1 Tax=Coleofasciculus chthonoplastes PCC 7420 TaxID=118168 RepID=B4VZU9_9CYAN|nr:hypothetical protein MC7420_2518 [Coleofasciculus chthonoplastes PCC 7420]
MENLLPFRPAPLPCPSVTTLKEDWKSGMKTGYILDYQLQHYSVLND